MRIALVEEVVTRFTPAETQLMSRMVASSNAPQAAGAAREKLLTDGSLIRPEPCVFAIAALHGCNSTLGTIVRGLRRLRRPPRVRRAVDHDASERDGHGAKPERPPRLEPDGRRLRPLRGRAAADGPALRARGRARPGREPCFGRRPTL